MINEVDILELNATMSWEGEHEIFAVKVFSKIGVPNMRKKNKSRPMTSRLLFTFIQSFHLSPFQDFHDSYGSVQK